MNSQRRRANDFTFSLASFHQTINNEEQSQSTSQICSEDSLDTISIKNRQCENDKYYSRNNESRAGSIILAGNLATQQCTASQTTEENITCNNGQSLLKDACAISDETSYLSLKPDLNKCINLFHNEHLNKEYDTLGEYLNVVTMLSETKIHEDISPHLNKHKTVEVQCDLIRDHSRSMSSDSLRSVALSNETLRKSKSCNMLNYSSKKRDTNYNIKDCQFSLAPVETVTKISSRKVETVSPSIVALSLLKPSTIPNKEDKFHSTVKDQKYDLANNEESSKEDPLEFENLKAFLYSLESQQPLKEVAMQGHLLKRMSLNFYESPKTFTERLLTIIEESVLNNSSAPEYPEISLCRLTEELRKMCKFIEDETIPEWPQSPGMSTSMYTRKSASRRSLGVLATPTSPRCNNKSPKKIFRRISKNSMKNQLHDSTNTFECLEAYCNELYSNEHRTFAMEKKNQLYSPSQNIDSILRTCEQQMASLDSPNIREQFKRAEISNMAKQSNKVPEKQDLQTDSESVPDIIKQCMRHNKHNEIMETDDLENTLMYEIAKKRQRCLDTAKIMMEIDTNSGPTVAQKIPTIVISDSSPTSNDSKFMETLMSVKRYQDYLEKYKPLLNSLQVESCGSPQDKRNVRTKISNEDFGARKIATASNKANVITTTTKQHLTTRKRSASPSLTKQKTPKSNTNKITVSKPKLFLTPGKMPVKSSKPKRTYFTNTTETSKERKPNITSHVKNIYRQIGSYDHVVSPVGMYIKGTDPPLMKNLRPKTDEMLLTPRKKQTVLSPKLSPKPKMKFRLSPKQLNEEQIEIRDENIADNFLHPKVHYKLPSHVRTIKEAENRKMGNRVNELLRSTQDKVVIRHEGRTKSVQTGCLKQPEIHYDSAEESVHIEQTARKTCFSRKQKD